MEETQEARAKKTNVGPLFGVTLNEVISAVKVCGDTSVLEALYPWAFKEAEMMAVMEKRAEPEERGEEHKEEEFVIRMTRKEAEVLRCITGHVLGKDSGPHVVTHKMYTELLRQGVEKTYKNVNIITLPDTWKEFYKEEE